MVEVKELSQAETKELCAENQLSYLAEESRAISAFDGDEVLGTCLYNLKSKSVSIKLINPENDITMADSMLRSALFIAANRGIMEAYFEKPVSAELIERLGFLKNAEEKSIDITNLFNPCGGCK